MLVLIAAGCPDSASHSPLPGASNGAKPVPQADTWGLIKPVKVMTPFVGSWVGETAKIDLHAGQSPDLRGDVESRSTMAIYVLVERKPLDFGDTAPYSIKISVNSTAQNHKAVVDVPAAEIRVRDEQTLELRTTPLPDAEFILSLSSETSTDGPSLRIESLKHQFQTATLLPL